MHAQSPLEEELLRLVEFVETGLLAPTLRGHLADFSTLELKVAAGDLLDWFSLRAILRERPQKVSGKTNPRVAYLVKHLPETFHCLCVHEGCLAYRNTVGEEQQHLLEDFVKERIWHPTGGAEHQSRK
jgi:hypothetical protein